MEEKQENLLQNTMQEKAKYYGNRIWRDMSSLGKWLILAVVTGCIVGAASSLFSYVLKTVTNVREEHLWIFYLLPVSGLIIVFLYQKFGKDDGGPNQVFMTIRSKDDVPLKSAPLIFISTALTHLTGGSAGREGAVIQLGGSIGNQLGRMLPLDEEDRHVMVMCGMSAAFSAIFGTPIAAVVFAMEVVSVGVMYYAALVPCVFASLIASKFARHMGIGPDTFLIKKIPDFLIVPSIKVILLAVCCAAVSVIFCVTLHSLGDFYRDKLKNPYIRIVVSSLVIVALTMVLHTTDYMGAGVPIIERAIAGHVVPLAFVWKIIFTALTLEAGFKGGEIVPSFCVGAAFGCLFGQLIGLSPSLCAALGMVSVFCGVTNCPITSLLIAFELFGYHGIPFFMIAISVSYLLSGYYGLYHDQTIVYSKYKTEYINRKARD